MPQDDETPKRDFLTDLREYGELTDCRCMSCGQPFKGHSTRLTCAYCINPPAQNQSRRDFNPYG